MQDQISDLLNDLSVRTYNICVSNKLTERDTILDYYKRWETFRYLKNCGERSNKELIELCQKLELDNQQKFVLKSQTLDDVYKLSRLQRQIINEYISINFTFLSNRSKNALVVYLEGKINVFALCEKIIFEKYFQFERIKNIGSISTEELKKFIYSIKNFITDVSNIETENELITHKTNLLLEKFYNITFFPQEIIQKRSVFKLIDYMICNDLLTSDNKSYILRNSFNIFNNSEVKTLNEVGLELRLTRERVRQLRLEIAEELKKSLLTICSIDEKILDKYNLEEHCDFVIISNKHAEKINSNNDTDFTTQFLVLILYNSLKSEFQLIGDIEDVLLTRSIQSKNSHNWKNIYLLNSKFNGKINIELLIDDLDKRTKEKINESYRLNFKNYISRFATLNIFELESLTEFCEHIINEELNLYVDINDDIYFERKTVKTLPEYIEEILEVIGEPTTMENLFELLNERNANLTKSPSALRGTCNRMESLIYFGRTSTYGLKKWEKEKSNIKGGTIKEMCIEYMQAETRPIHIFELLNYVNKYRSTNHKSLLSNLTIDPLKSFIFYKQFFIGLKTLRSIYDEEKYLKLPKHLGKEILRLIDKKIKTKPELVQYLSSTYEIDTNEAFCILEKLSETNSLLIKEIYSNENKRN